MQCNSIDSSPVDAKTISYCMRSEVCSLTVLVGCQTGGGGRATRSPTKIKKIKNNRILYYFPPSPYSRHRVYIIIIIVICRAVSSCTRLFTFYEPTGWCSTRATISWVKSPDFALSNYYFISHFANHFATNFPVNYKNYFEKFVSRGSSGEDVRHRGQDPKCSACEIPIVSFYVCTRACQMFSVTNIETAILW